MHSATDISRRFWNLPQKAEEETVREECYIDDIIQKSHIERLILENLRGISTVFDGGAGYGRFSIMLAKLGKKVTHFDISEVMIAKAKELAEKADVLDNMTFVHGSLEDLSAFSDREFDMVLSFDAPISYTYPKQEDVIGGLIRITRKKMIISVYSRLAWTYLFDPAQKLKYLLNPSSNDFLTRWTLDYGVKQLPTHPPDFAKVNDFFKTGLMENPEDTAQSYARGEAPWPVSYTFMPDELLAVFAKNGVIDVCLSGPGALSRSIPAEVLKNIFAEEQSKKEFLDCCFWYDSQLWCAGMGKDNLVACASIAGDMA